IAPVPGEVGEHLLLARKRPRRHLVPGGSPQQQRSSELIACSAYREIAVSQIHVQLHPGEALEIQVRGGEGGGKRLCQIGAAFRHSRGYAVVAHLRPREVGAFAFSSAISLRMLSTVQAVVRGPSLTGEGNLPVFTPCHHVDTLTGNGLPSPTIDERRRKPVC